MTRVMESIGGEACICGSRLSNSWTAIATVSASLPELVLVGGVAPEAPSDPPSPPQPATAIATTATRAGSRQPPSLICIPLPQ